MGGVCSCLMHAYVPVHEVLCFAVLALWISPLIWGEITAFMRASMVGWFFSSSFLNFKKKGQL